MSIHTDKFIVQPKTEIAVERLSSISVIHQDCEWIQFQYEAKFSFIVILLFDVNILKDIFLLIDFLYSCIYVIEFHLLYIKFHPLCCNICIYENCYNNCNNINISNNNKSSINSLL